jgi:NitT/TauT family transport system substrate-binding protein
MGDPTVIQQVYLTNEPYYIRRHGIKVRAIELADDDYNPYRVIVTTKAYAHAHPETVRKFVAASMRGWDDFIFHDAGPGRDLILALNTETTREFVDASIATLRSEHIIDGSPGRGEAIGALSLDRLQRQINRLAEIGYIKAPFPAGDVATTEFLPR